MKLLSFFLSFSLLIHFFFFFSRVRIYRQYTSHPSIHLVGGKRYKTLPTMDRPLLCIQQDTSLSFSSFSLSLLLLLLYSLSFFSFSTFLLFVFVSPDFHEWKRSPNTHTHKRTCVCMYALHTPCYIRIYVCAVEQAVSMYTQLVIYVRIDCTRWNIFAFTSWFHWRDKSD